MPDSKNNSSGRHAYATLTVNDQTRKTKVVYGDKNPIWDQEFGFVFDDKPESFRIDVWDYDEVKEDAAELLGNVEYKLDEFYKYQGKTTTDEKLNLASYTYVPGGTIELKLQCRLVPQTVVRWLSGYGHEEIAKLLRFASASLNKTDLNGRVSHINFLIFIFFIY